MLKLRKKNAVDKQDKSLNKGLINKSFLWSYGVSVSLIKISPDHFFSECQSYQIAAFLG